MGNCCQLLLGGAKYEKVTAQEGKATGIELQTTSEDFTATRKERGGSTGKKDGGLRIEGKIRNKKTFGGGKARTLAPPPEDLARLKEELTYKLREFFVKYNPSQANPKSIDHIVAFYTSFDTMDTLNARLRDKYGSDLSSIEMKSPGMTGYSPPSPPPFGAKAVVSASEHISAPGEDNEDTGLDLDQFGIEDGDSEAIEDGKMQDDNLTLDDKPEENTVEGTGTREARADSALQRAEMFEQTWQSDIPSKNIVLRAAAGQGFKSLDDLTGALSSAGGTLVASGEVDGTAKAYFYTLNENKEITLVELASDRDEASGETNEYKLLCKYTEDSALEEALKRISSVLHAERQ
mmetsp:Transcript_14543/g.35453  ORF Transcript_14543/g.35453 Transcript_14543/m.35453 type:complete len:349 (+) Transcript_14543:169-1215(+)